MEKNPLTLVQWLFGLMGFLSVLKTDVFIRSTLGAVIYGATSAQEPAKPLRLMVYFIAGISFCCYNSLFIAISWKICQEGGKVCVRAKWCIKMELMLVSVA